MIWILDAYNVIHAVPELDAQLDRDLKAARDSLITLCEDIKSRNGSLTKIVLVFDGKSEYQGLYHDSPPGIETVYSNTGEEADERIVRILETFDERSRRQVTVISNDNFVTNHARAYGVPVMSVWDFYGAVSRAPFVPKNRQKSGPSQELPRDVADRITEDYRKQLGID